MSRNRYISKRWVFFQVININSSIPGSKNGVKYHVVYLKYIQNQMVEVSKVMTQITWSTRKFNKKFVTMQISRLLKWVKKREIPHKIKFFFKKELS